MKILVRIIIISLIVTGWTDGSMVLAEVKTPLDNMPPVRIVSPQGGERVHGKITVKAVANDPKQIDYVDFYIQEPGAKDRYGWQDFTPPYFWGGEKRILDTTLFDDGQASVAAFPSPIDSRRHNNTNRVHFTIDNGKPKIKIQKPKDGNELPVAQSMTIRIDATDSKGIKKSPGIVAVRVYLDGSLLHTITEEPFEAKLSTCLLAPGRHSVRAVAEDSEGLHNADTINIHVNPKGSCIIVNKKSPE